VADARKHWGGGTIGMVKDSLAARLLQRRKGPRGLAMVEEVSAAWGEGEAVDLRLKWDEW
jgi:hypothetical protein